MATILTGRLTALAVGGLVSKNAQGNFTIDDEVYIGAGGAIIDADLTCLRIKCDGSQQGIDANNPLNVRLGDTVGNNGEIKPVVINTTSASSWNFDTDPVGTKGFVNLVLFNVTINIFGTNSGFGTWSSNQSQANINMDATDSFIVSWDPNGRPNDENITHFPPGGGTIDGLTFTYGEGAFFSKSPLSTRRLSNTFNPSKAVGFAVASIPETVELQGIVSGYYKTQQTPGNLFLTDSQISIGINQQYVPISPDTNRISLFKRITVDLQNSDSPKVTAWDDNNIVLMDKTGANDKLPLDIANRVNYYRFGPTVGKRTVAQVNAGTGAEYRTEFTNVRVFRYGMLPIQMQHTFDSSSKDNLNTININGIAVVDSGIISNSAAVSIRTNTNSSQHAYEDLMKYIEDNHSSILPSFVFPSYNSVLKAGDFDINIKPSFTDKIKVNGNSIDIKSSTSFSGGITTNGVVTVTDCDLIIGLYTCDINSNIPPSGNFVEINIEATHKLVMTEGGTITLDDCKITQIENTSGDPLIVKLSNGTPVPTTLTETNGSITIVDPMIVTFTSVPSDAVLYVEREDNSTHLYNDSSNTSIPVSIERDYSGQTFTYIVKQAGFTAQSGSFQVTESTTRTIPISLKEIKTAQGNSMYTGSSSNLVNVSFDGLTQANIDIGNGEASLHTTYDSTEKALETEDGCKWLVSGLSNCSLFNSPGGDYFFMTSKWRLRRRSTGDDNATLDAFAQSTDGVIVDGTNGGVLFLTSDSPTAIAKAVRVELAAELARIDIVMSDIGSNVWKEDISGITGAGIAGKELTTARKKANLSASLSA